MKQAVRTVRSLLLPLVYEERRRAVIVPYNHLPVESILKKEDWNKYQIIAVEVKGR
jgi:hypothetical protein